MLVITDNNNENTYHLVNHEIMSEIVKKSRAWRDCVYGFIVFCECDVVNNRPMKWLCVLRLIQPLKFLIGYQECEKPWYQNDLWKIICHDKTMLCTLLVLSLSK